MYIRQRFRIETTLNSAVATVTEKIRRRNEKKTTRPTPAIAVGDSDQKAAMIVNAQDPVSWVELVEAASLTDHPPALLVTDEWATPLLFLFVLDAPPLLRLMVIDLQNGCVKFFAREAARSQTILCVRRAGAGDELLCFSN